MHVATLLYEEMFAVRRGGQAASVDDIFPGWTVQDRFGILIDLPPGGLGASHLIQLAITRFYGIKPERRRAKAVSPEIYAFHIGTGHGSHADFDFWPARREIVIGTDPREILDAINDRGITRLAVPSREPRQCVHRPKEIDCAKDRMTSAFLYSPAGTMPDADFTIEGLDPRTEYNAGKVLAAGLKLPPARGGKAGHGGAKEIDPAWYEHRARHASDVNPDDRERAAEWRRRLGPHGHALEAYRFTSVEDALARL